MRNRRIFPVLALASLIVFAAAARPQAFTPQVRIINPIDENNLTTLKGNTHPLANARTDRGPVDPSLPMTDLILLLSRSTEQQAAFDKFVANQYDPQSPDFHHWLSPDEVGSDFGPSQTDIQTVSNWLTGRGFTISEISKDRTRIRFNGTAGQVQSAFHTEIHNLEVHGEAHIGNMSDPKIPAALVPAVAGIKALHNFFPKPLHRAGAKVKFNSALGKWQREVNAYGRVALAGKTPAPSLIHPEFGVTSGGNTVEDVAPYDFATIYNVLPLWTAGSPIDGTGQKIAIAGTSNINLADVTTFRKTFGLPAYTTNAPQVIIAHGSDPGDCTPVSSSCDSDLTENSLDVEWSGAVAKGAQIILAISGSTSISDDTVYDSSDYVVSHNTAPILSVSYGQCELFEGTAGNATYNSMWQTAASQGIAVFVASGDAGAALCDDDMDGQYGTPWASQYGLAVNGLASSPYDTAVGGTDLNWGQTSSQYWNSTNNTTTGASAKGYIPEVPWNDTCTNPLTLPGLQSDASIVKYTGNAVTDSETACNFVATDSIYVFQNYPDSNGDPANISYYVDTVGGSGGVSACSINTTSGNTAGACTGGYSKPSWQTALTPADNARDLPDVSFFAANGFLGSAYLVCVSANGSCLTSTNPTTEPVAQEIGGTSVASPAMAGVMALINQKTGSAQGSPNAKLYTLAGAETYSSCSAESVTAGSTSCYFNDIDTGTISMPCDFGATNGGIVYDGNSGKYVLDSSLEQAGIDAPNCTPIHSGDTVGILDGVDAGVGYDLASGLGSLNVTNVVNAYAAVVVPPSFTVAGVTPLSFSPGATTGNTSAITVTPAYGFTGAVALSCAVTPAGTTAPTCAISPASVSVTGTTAQSATLTISSSSSTSAGAYTATVTGVSTSPALNETFGVAITIVAPVNPNATFALTATAASPATVAPGATAMASVTAATTTGYTGTVTYTCTQTSGPTNATADTPICAFNTAAVAMGAATQFSVETEVAQASVSKPQIPSGKSHGWAGAGGGALLALLMFFGIPARRRSWRAMVGMLMALAVLGSLAACGGGGGGSTTTSNPGTAAGTYVYTVTATGSIATPATVAPVTFTVVVVN